MKTITNITLNGVGRFTIDEDKIKCNNPVKAVLKGSSLELTGNPTKGKGGNFISNLFGGSVSFNGGITYKGVNIVGNTAYLNGVGVSSSGNDIEISNVSESNRIIIDGVDVSSAVNAALKDKKAVRKSDAELRAEKEYALPSDTTWEIETISVCGSSDITVKGNFLSKTVSLRVSGQGDVNVTDANLRNVSATVSGQGDIKFSNTTAEVAVLSVSGQGDIKGLHATSSVVASVSGMGNISCTTANSCTVQKNRSGMGGINIRSH